MNNNLLENMTARFYVYVRSKPKVQDKEGSDGNVITEGFLMAKHLNKYFRFMFTREGISALPVPDTKYKLIESYLQQLIVTPKMVAKKVRDLTDNKSQWSGWDSTRITFGNCKTN